MTESPEKLEMMSSALTLRFYNADVCHTMDTNDLMRCNLFSMELVHNFYKSEKRMSIYDMGCLQSYQALPFHIDSDEMLSILNQIRELDTL